MRVEVLDGLERRRRWSQDDKTRIVEETLVPGDLPLPISST
jgi:transposase